MEIVATLVNHGADLSTAIPVSPSTNLICSFVGEPIPQSLAARLTNDDASKLLHDVLRTQLLICVKVGDLVGLRSLAEDEGLNDNHVRH